MPQFDYLAPSTVEEAVRALAMPGARPLAGGTDLLVQLRSGRVRPPLVVDLKRIAGATGIRAQGGGFVIGAATPGANVDGPTCRARPPVQIGDAPDSG